jgi:methionine sulfoxide reductase heme-binding subunit
MRYKTRRLIRHIGLATGSSLVVWVLQANLSSDDPIQRLSLATAYVSLALLIFTLSIGPANVIRGRSNPVNTGFRRDFGIWGGLWGLFHIVVGLQVHFKGSMQFYFIFPAESEHFMPLRYDPFGLANWTGLICGLILIMLLSLSNNLSLKKLGIVRWKSLQRWNYVAFAALFLHGAAYQLIESRSVGWIIVFIVASLIVAGMQFTGYKKIGRHSDR